MKKWFYLIAFLLVCPAAYAQNSRALSASAAHFQANARAYGLTNPAQELKVRSIRDGGYGLTHIRYDQYFSGVRVFEGEAISHVDASGRVTVTNSLRGNLAVNTKPTISATQAMSAALAAVAPAVRYDRPTAALEILPKGDRSSVNQLVWHVTVSVENFDGPARWEYFVNAHRGNVAFSYDSLPTDAAAGTGKTMWSGDVAITVDFTGGTYFLRDPTRGTSGGNYTTDMLGGTTGNGTIFSRATNVFGNNLKDNSDRATAGADAHYGMAWTWDYFKNNHGRNGIDGLGTRTFSRVHYGSGYENANWNDTCFCMTYGDGASTFYSLTALDVTGHEMAHGVMSREANLTYQGESGGLNESSSDMFGTLVEFYVNNPSDTPEYWIGERIMRANWTTGSYVQTKALRYMDDPNKDGISPACWYNGVGSLNVHYSSGPANHMFWLLSGDVGTTRTSKCNGRVVSGIGRTDAARIWYKAISDYMTASSKYKNARAACLSAATELFGTNSAQYNAVSSAFAGINVVR
jgi:Zn-dependent metalloprotease